MQNISFNSLKKKLNRYPHLDELEVFLERVIRSGVKLVVLFGSLTRGNYTPYSDIDVLCVYDENFKDLKERFHRTYQYSDGLVQPITSSLIELKASLLEGNSFLHHIFKEGLILYGDINQKELSSWINEGKLKLDMEYFSTY
jgi:predicted nucleotidyltransferase